MSMKTTLAPLSIAAAAFAMLAPSWPQRFAQSKHYEPRKLAPNPLAPNGRHMPHQSQRERSRRIGKHSWAAFRAADRQRRGLPVGQSQEGEG